MPRDEAEIADAVDQEGLHVGEDRGRPGTYQKPISRYETRPTASQPKNSCMKLFGHHQHQHREGK